MKKICTIILIFCIMISSVTCVFSSEDTQKIGELIISVKEKLSLNDDEYEFDNYYADSYNNKSLYSFSWKNKSDESDYIRVRVDDNVRIYSYYKTDNNDYSTKFLKYSREYAKNAAIAFMEKIDAPKELSEPEISKYGSYYDLYFRRIHNGTVVMENNVNCSISGDTGEVVSYNISWTDNVEFKEVSQISQEKANEIYKNELGYELYYVVKTENFNKSAGLVYKPKYNEDIYIDAINGEIKTHKEIYFESEENAKMLTDSGGGGAGNARLSEKEIALLEELENVISVEEAVKKAKNIEEFEIDDSYYLENYNIYKRDNLNYVISVYMISDKDENKAYKNISLDGKTGKILSYNSYSYNFEDEKSENVMKDEDGRKKTEEFIKKYYKEDYKNITPYNTISDSNGFYRYERKFNDIRVLNNGINVNVDLKTGKITSVTYTWDEVEFPSALNVQPPENVYKKIFAENNIELNYILKLKDEKLSEYEPVLVYNEKNNMIFDAHTLEEVSLYTLETVKNSEKPVYTDISGHYAEDQIKKLLEEDIYLEGNEFMPEKAITYKEFASLLYMTMSKSEPRPLNELYKSSLNYFNLDINEENENNPITRLDGVKMLLDIMGYGEFAKIKGIFNCPFTDILEEDKGYVSIAAGLNIVSTADTLFYKDAYLKRADAFIIIFNYMSR